MQLNNVIYCLNSSLWVVSCVYVFLCACVSPGFWRKRTWKPPAMGGLFTHARTNALTHSLTNHHTTSQLFNEQLQHTSRRGIKASEMITPHISDSLPSHKNSSLMLINHNSLQGVLKLPSNGFAGGLPCKHPEAAKTPINVVKNVRENTGLWRGSQWFAAGSFLGGAC